MHLIRVPSLAENVEVATIASWLVKAGDEITPGAELVELITEKAEFTLEAEEEVSGTLLACLAPEKSTLPVGYILCVVGEESDREKLAAAREENAGRLQQDASTGVSLDSFTPRAVPQIFGAVRAAPAARRLAKELGLELAEIAAALNLDRPLKEQDVQDYYQNQQEGM
ncbi:MAG: E3 binding domain-containing protein [Planctomycetes bacterium]|nr:E3 binding domain-containing protein [Planctomycetota bacterium]